MPASWPLFSPRFRDNGNKKWEQKHIFKKFPCQRSKKELPARSRKLRLRIRLPQSSPSLLWQRISNGKKYKTTNTYACLCSRQGKAKILKKCKTMLRVVSAVSEHVTCKANRSNRRYNKSCGTCCRKRWSLRLKMRGWTIVASIASLFTVQQCIAVGMHRSFSSWMSCMPEVKFQQNMKGSAAFRSEHELVTEEKESTSQADASSKCHVCDEPIPNTPGWSTGE